MTKAYRRLPGPARSRLRRSAMARALLRPLDRRAREAEYTIPSGPAQGIKLIPSPAPPIIATGDYELEVQAFLERTLAPGGVFYDIGANVGLFTLLADRLVSPGGAVVAFEPQPRNLEALRRNLGLNELGADVRVVEAAASDRTGTGGFDAETSMTGKVARFGTVEIDVVRIDDFVSDHPDIPPDVVKIDVEGHEISVLAGMTTTLREQRPTAIIEGHRTRPQIEATLGVLDYRVTSLEGPGRERHLLAEPA